jgi:branched-chain amino acid transport system ATP-binding protein
VPFELTLDNVTAGYAGMPIITNVSFALRKGQRLGIIGRNGAGKTTTLATIMGLAERQQGSIRLNGEEIGHQPTFRRARAGVGYVPQTRDIFPSLNVEENLLSALNGRARAGDALASSYRMFPRLKERRRNGGNQLSGGEQQMLAVARALVGRPGILLLDEPLEGLAPQVRDELMDGLLQMSEETGVGCLMVEQHVDVVLDFATSIIILEHGTPVFSGSSAELRQSPDVLNRTIGLQKVQMT